MTMPERGLQASRCRLRSILDNDIHWVFKGLSDPRVTQYYGVHFDSLEAIRKQMEWFATLERNEQGKWWAVCKIESGEVMGAGGIYHLDKHHKKAEVGFWLLPEFHGKGYMTEAMPLIIANAFSTFDLHRIEGFVESENTACKGAMQKLGFTFEGTMHDCEVKNGRFISLDIYAMLHELAIKS